MSSLRQIRQTVDRQRGMQEQLAQTREDLQIKLEILDEEGQSIEEARVIVQEVARQTQEQLEFHLSDLVSMAMSSVFGEEAYQLKVKFIPKRGRTEAQIKFIRHGLEYDPLEASGGGVVDVAAFGLRIALWTLQQPRSRAVMLLDEPFRFLSRNLQPKASQMLKEISTRLGVQLIIVSHDEALIAAADKVITVEKIGDVSRIA